MQKIKFKLFLYIATFVMGSSAFGQLSGNYTIGGTTSSSNFATWSDFTTAVSGNGVSGNVYVTVVSDLTVTSVVQFSQNATNPTSSTKKIYINGNGKKVSGSLSYEVLHFNGIDYLEIKNLKVVNSSGSTLVQGVRFSNGANYNVLDSCTVDLSGMSTTSVPEGAYLSFASNNTSLRTTTSSHNGIGNVVKNNIFTTSSSNSPGPAFGIVDQQGTSVYATTSSGNSFLNNKILNVYSVGVFAKYVNGEQFIGNEISREKASSNSLMDTSMIGIFMSDAYVTAGSNVASQTLIHDFPYKGYSSGSNGLSNFIGIYFYNVYGSSSYTNKIEKNNIYNIAFVNSFNGIASENTVALNIFKNTILRVSGSTGTSTGIYCYSGADVNIVENLIKKCDFGSGNGGNGVLIYTMDVQIKYFNENSMTDNHLDSNISADELYGMVAFYNSDWVVNRNKVTSNKAVGTYSIFWGTYFYFIGNLSFHSNLLALNDAKQECYGYYGLNYNSGYSNSLFQNTIYVRENNSGQTSYGFFMDEDSYISFVGNIVDMKGSGSAYPAYINTYTNLGKVDYNTFYIKNFASESWNLGTTSFSNFAGWKSSADVGLNEKFGDPVFQNASKYDFKSNCFENQNNVDYNVANKMDNAQSNRNLIKNDRGAFENFMDLNLVKSDLNVTNQICSGNERTLKVYIKNGFVDTAYNFQVCFTVNGKLTKETVTQKILPGDTGVYTFKNPLIFVSSGQNKVQIFLQIPDDNLKNDTLNYVANVLPAPGGAGFTASAKKTSPNNAIYQKSMVNDVTILGVPVIYDLKAPRQYTNSQYGSSGSSKWIASISASTKWGKSVAGSSFVSPSGSTDLEFKFQTNDSTLEDSIIVVKVKVTDNGTGCDTVYSRQVYIFPSPKLKVQVPSSNCLGDTVVIKNNSTYKVGYLDNFWTFGTGNSGDTSNAVDPIFIYASAGTYAIKLTAKTKPYGFVFESVSNIVVNAKPQVQFSKQNACIGNDLTLVNNTTPSSSTMTWDFGDGNGNQVNNNTTIKLKYTKQGNYAISLVASSNGCKSSLTQKVTIFDKPVPDFSKVSGNCDNEKISFQNKTSIGAGNFGSKWDFDDNGKTSLDKNPSYTFGSAGTKKVKLIVLSEFGCMDSITKSIGVKESPKIDFEFDKTCIFTQTNFVNKTPLVTGVNPSVKWYLGDGDSMTADNFMHTWKSLGSKNIVLNVFFDNGCFGSLSKQLVVLDEPIVKFTFDPKCTNDTVKFDNQSTGNAKLSYKWNFGDNDTSILEKPMHRYLVEKSKTFNVELIVNMEGACSAKLVKQIDIYELPRTCDFNYTPDYSFAYFGARLEPMDVNLNVGGQNNVDYNWTVKGLGNQNSKDLNAAVQYNLGGDGTYNVTMLARTRDYGCSCSISRQIVMDRLTAKSVESEKYSFYPNPIINKLWISSLHLNELSEVHVLNVGGQYLNVPIDKNSSTLWTLDFSGVSRGTYLVEYSVLGKRIVKQVVVQ